MKLFDKTQIGKLKLKNSMIMSAMTRSRADVNGIVGEMQVKYYTQRISAGMIISEAINISEGAIGSPFTPGIFTMAQINAWKKVTTAVHNEGGIIIAQLWHTGRVGHSVDRMGSLPVAPSAIAINNGTMHFTSQGLKDFETPHALTVEEIKEIVKDYGQAAKNAMAAGFDGVELHSANGYLPNQFLADNANKRTDEYGGSIANKTRFVLEVMQELIGAIGGDKVGIKLSPFHPYGDILFDNPIKTFTYLIGELNKLDFAYIELMKRSPMFPVPHYPLDDEIELFGKQVKHTLIANTGYEKISGEAELEKGIAKAISFGTLFLANPDLPKRFEKNAPLNQPDRATMFGGAAQGYIDYPFLND